MFGADDVLVVGGGLRFSVRDGLALDVTGELLGSECRVKQDRIRCRNAAGTVLASFLPRKDGGAGFDYVVRLRKLDVVQPQGAHVRLAISHGDVDRVGTNATCRVLAGKLACKDI